MEEGLRVWLDAAGCRRLFINTHFNNPPPDVVWLYSGEPQRPVCGRTCCDRCGDTSQEVPTTPSRTSHNVHTTESPDLPSPRSTLRSPLTPLRTKNVSGKRPMARSPSPSPEHSHKVYRSILDPGTSDHAVTHSLRERILHPQRQSLKFGPENITRKQLKLSANGDRRQCLPSIRTHRPAMRVCLPMT